MSARRRPDLPARGRRGAEEGVSRHGPEASAAAAKGRPPGAWKAAARGGNPKSTVRLRSAGRPEEEPHAFKCFSGGSGSP